MHGGAALAAGGCGGGAQLQQRHGRVWQGELYSAAIMAGRLQPAAAAALLKLQLQSLARCLLAGGSFAAAL